MPLTLSPLTPNTPSYLLMKYFDPKNDLQSHDLEAHTLHLPLQQTTQASKFQDSDYV